MNDTAIAGGATGASLIPSTTDAFTIAHLVVLALFALAVIAAIVWGMRLKRQRKAALRDIVSHNEESANAAERDASEPVARVADETDSGASTADRPRVERSATETIALETPIVAAPPAPAVEQQRDEEMPFEPTALSDPQEEPAAPVPLADAPIVASGPLEAGPATEAASEPSANARPAAAPQPTPATSVTVGGSPADAPVTTLKGLGPKLAARLGELGISTVGQVAALSDDDAARLDAQLGPFAGRITRDRWIEQARFLAAGDRAGFEAVFGRL